MNNEAKEGLGEKFQKHLAWRNVTWQVLQGIHWNEPVFLQSPSLPGCLNSQRLRHQTLRLLCSTVRGASSPCGG